MNFDEAENPEDLSRENTAIAPQMPNAVGLAGMTQMAAIESSKAVQEVQAALVIAKRFPRDIIAAEIRVSVECQRPQFAEKSQYSYPRGGNTISGPSIKMAEMLARHWGNIKYGFKPIERGEGSSTLMAYCWDLETNTQAERTFTVEHAIQLKTGKKKILTDPRDIYEIEANNAQRRVRACILEVIPGDVVDRALAKCAETLTGGKSKVPLIDVVKRMAAAFQEKGISKEMIERRLRHGLENMTREQIVEYQGIYNSICDGQSTREDWFNLGEQPQGGKADKFNARKEESNGNNTAGA